MQDHQQTTGTVKWFNDSKGFGFIQPDSGDYAVARQDKSKTSVLERHHNEKF